MVLIHLAGFDVHLSRKHVKNINLRIDRRGNVHLAAPLACPLDYIQQFLQKKHGWINAHRARLQQHAQSAHPVYESGEQHFFLGKAYFLIIHERAKQSNVVLEGQQLCCYLISEATLASKKALLKHWQRQQMEAVIPKLIQKWEPIVGVKVNQWKIRAMKTRWGSCNTKDKRICLNLYLIQHPLVCLEYVIVHELVHLLEASHNQRFYALMSQFMPEWKDYRNLLKLNFSRA